MKLTTKGRYAVTAVLDLALNNQSGPVSLAGISERQNISLSYLEQLFRRLRKQGLVDSVRGPGGGYQLAMEPSKISIAAVITAVDEKVETTSCGGLSNCKDNAQCLTHDLWEALSQQINGFLTKTTLGQLVDSHEAKNNTTAQTVELTLNNQQTNETEHQQSTSA